MKRGPEYSVSGSDREVARRPVTDGGQVLRTSGPVVGRVGEGGEVRCPVVVEGSSSSETGRQGSGRCRGDDGTVALPDPFDVRGRRESTRLAENVVPSGDRGGSSETRTL